MSRATSKLFVCLAVALCMAGCPQPSAPAGNAQERGEAGATTPLLAYAQTDEPQHLRKHEVLVGHKMLRLEVAHTTEQRRVGLMFRRDLGPDDGMIFCFPTTEVQSFWMRNTPTPLSIAYVGPDGTIVHIADMRPFDDSSVSSKQPAAFAIEMHKGWFKRNGIIVGIRVRGLEKLPRAE